jgi:hypothetical protein
LRKKVGSLSAYVKLRKRILLAFTQWASSTFGALPTDQLSSEKQALAVKLLASLLRACISSSAEDISSVISALQAKHLRASLFSQRTAYKIKAA